MSDWDPLPGTDWHPLLRQEFAKPYWANLQTFVTAQRACCSVYPPQDEVLAALHLTPCAETKVVILGQDPYHGPGQAHGLCFSVPRGVSRPPSLASIHRELQTDLLIGRPDHGSLKTWAHRGVLLLNSILTVREGTPCSHDGMGWETFTDAVIQFVTEKSHPVFLLWGKEAQAKEALITRITGSQGKIIKSSHPSPPACYLPCGDSPPFIGSKPFSKANDALIAAGQVRIDWSLTE